MTNVVRRKQKLGTFKALSLVMDLSPTFAECFALGPTQCRRNNYSWANRPNSSIITNSSSSNASNNTTNNNMNSNEEQLSKFWDSRQCQSKFDNFVNSWLWKTNQLPEQWKTVKVAHRSYITRLKFTSITCMLMRLDLWHTCKPKISRS